MEEITIHVEKPVCNPEKDACPVPLEAASALIDGVNTIIFKEDEEEAVIRFDEKKTSSDTVRHAVQELGYEVEPSSGE